MITNTSVLLLSLLLLSVVLLSASSITSSSVIFLLSVLLLSVLFCPLPLASGLLHYYYLQKYYDNNRLYICGAG